MYKILLSAVCALTLTACVSDEERLGSKYQFQSMVQDQCANTLGFKVGTTNHMKCQLFYEDMFKYEVENDYWSYSKVSKMEQQIYDLNQQCQSYWGGAQITKSALWTCVQQKGNSLMEEAKHQKELKEQERVMRNAIADGQKDAYEEARLQARIDEERDRVAKLTGKNPKKIRCKTSKKSNGYIKVKCK